MENNKKVAAAISAVMSYIRQEEDIAQMQSVSAGRQAAAAKGSPNLWGISGRQAVMQMRNMIQMKAFHRLK